MIQKRIKVICGLSILTFICLSFLGVEMLDALSYSVSAVAILDWLYNRFFWRFNPFEKTPKIYGVYNADIVSNYNGNTAYKSTITIKQTLSHISIVEVMEDGCCESVTASIAKTTPDGPWFLYYTYLTHPKLSASDDMHYGTSVLRISNNGILRGGYFTNRLSQTAGSVTLTRVKK